MATQGQNLLQVQKASKAFGARKLFDQITFSINESEHVGVIGPNGAGKTTLFKALLEEEDFDEGQVIRSKHLRVGYLSQHDLWREGETGNDYLERTCVLPLWEVKSNGRHLRLSEEVLAREITSLSGGYRMRIKLLSLLGQDPNLMLLDEPTNYLDLETTLLLENFLQNFDGAFLLISHDREFLKRTTDHILEVEGGDVVKYNGHIDDYFEQKELLRSQLEAQAAHAQEKRKAVLDFVSRFGAKATKARQAQSRLKQLQKMEVIEIKSLPVRAAIRLPDPPPVGKLVAELREVDLGYGQNVILKDVNLEIKRGEHVAVVGLNGAGKSTLLKALSGQLQPVEGTVDYGHQVELAIFNQHVVEVLTPHATVLQSLEEAAHPDVSLQEIKNIAGSLLFSGEDVLKKIKVLSGGEKSRVALGQILLKKVPFLLFDEPTNHLDFDTVEALIQALQTYKGSLIVVSHDRGFIRRVGTKIIEVSKGQVEAYPGTYDEYVWRLQQRLASDEDIEAEQVNIQRRTSQGAGKLSVSKKTASPDRELIVESKTSSDSRRALSKNEQKQKQKRLDQVDKELSLSQKKIEEINEWLSLNGASNSEMIQAKTLELGELVQKSALLEEEWLELSQDLS